MTDTVILAVRSAVQLMGVRREIELAGRMRIVAEPRTEVAALAAMDAFPDATVMIDPALVASPNPLIARAIAERRPPCVVLGGTAAPPPVSAAPGVRPDCVLIAVSTGGPDVLLRIVTALAQPCLPIVVAQHMPADQTGPFARHLAQRTGQPVTEAKAGPVPPGTIAILPGGSDWSVAAAGPNPAVRPQPLAVSPFHPNADVLFGSAARSGLAAAAAVLTGMGSDGAAGARLLSAAGLPVLVQTAASCAVPGMPAATRAACPRAEALDPEAMAVRLNGWAALRAAQP